MATEEPIDKGIEKGILSGPAEIPNKLYFKIGEVSRLAGVKPYVLRYWETEFPTLGPKKSNTSQRQYRRKDVELVLEIKRLLYEKRFTIEGARKFLEQRGKVPISSIGAIATPSASVAQGALFAMGPQPEEVPKEKLEPIRKELKAILDLLR